MACRTTIGMAKHILIYAPHVSNGCVHPQQFRQDMQGTWLAMYLAWPARTRKGSLCTSMPF